MFRLEDSILPLNTDNDTIQYSPKLKKFVPNKHTIKPYIKLGKIVIRCTGQNLNRIYQKSHQRLLHRITHMHADTYWHLHYEQLHKHDQYTLKTTAIAIRFKNKRIKKDMTHGNC